MAEPPGVTHSPFDITTMAEPPPKRKRPDSEAASDTIIRSEVWFEDGNLLVQVQTTQFRLFRGSLAFHSPKLKALIEALPENAALVLDDNPADWEHVSKKLFHHAYPDKELLPFVVIEAFARIGKKYEIQWLFNRARKLLNAAYPSVLDVWLSAHLNHTGATAHALESSILARVVDLPHLLPVAFWYLTFSHRISGLVTARAAALSEEDKKSILDGFRKRLHAESSTTLKWLQAEGSDKCKKQGGSECTVARLKLFASITKNSRGQRGWSWLTSWEKDLCEPCIAAGKALHTAGVRDLWECLPSLFNLPPWHELRK
ncbi:F-box domain-containing protein [Mycena indigotica]|uniref:F-box domain-containing protein n=1 Tax=Mycena indigotica TaxID=2126181 RepID=A0A8H6S3L1_9AGAR|nr:F-box domain-containing protein [Mycena indigotica]KAF7291416.1 F-box domain-containing protein [Mycena indigotica]